MVTPETEAKFEKRGVFLVTAEMGRRLFRQELTRRDGTAVEVICGQGPWESQEAEHGVIRPAAPAAPRPDLGPLLGGAELHTRSSGEKSLHVHLDPRWHVYLQDYLIDGKPVLPAPAAIELLAEAARSIWPRWCVAEVRELRLLENIEIGSGGCDIEIHLSPPPYGSSQGFEVSASIKTAGADAELQTHFQCVLGMELKLPAAAAAPRALHHERALSVATAYGEWLPRAARLQVIENIEGLSAAGAGARVRGSEPADWLSSGHAGHWMFDPALLDAAAQIVALWARAYRDESAVPIQYGRVVRYRDVLPPLMHLDFTQIGTAEPGTIRGNAVFFDGEGVAVLAIEDLDCATNSAANLARDLARAAESALA